MWHSTKDQKDEKIETILKIFIVTYDYSLVHASKYTAARYIYTIHSNVSKLINFFLFMLGHFHSFRSSANYIR